MTKRLALQPASSATTGRAVARLPMDQMAQLGLQAGDTVSLTSDRTTHARVLPGPRGSDVIEVDETLRGRIGGTWGGMVSVSPAPLPTLNTAIVKVTGALPTTVADLGETLYDLPLTEGDALNVVFPMGQNAQVEVMSTDPSPAGLFSDRTSLSIQSEPAAALYDGIGGMADQIARVHEMVAVPLLRPELFERLGVSAPRGVLFVGPPGSGKTLLARSIAARTSAAFFQINGPEIVSKHYGESEAALRKVFSAAAKQAPAIIFIDEIDAIAPRRDSLSGEKQVERRVVAQLLTLMDGMAERGRIILMAATNLPDSLDPALRRPGRFDREIAFAPPTADQRLEILQIHLRNAPCSDDVDLKEIAQASHGYVGADLAALAREASLAALDRAVKAAGSEQNLNVADLYLTQSDLCGGLAATSPSTLRDTIVESPIITFADVGGMEQAKTDLQEAVIWPLAHKEKYAALGLSPLAGILLSGPPGTGKTLLARALATESGMNFIPVRPTRIMSQYLGEAERAIADIFAKARQSAPCLVFFDELDALAPRRSGKDAVLDRIVAQLLTEMDGMARNPDVIVLAATNRAASIDPALTRPGRFDLVISIPLPDQATRKAILDVHLGRLPLGDDVQPDSLAKATEGASGAALATLAQTAARAALRRSLNANDSAICVTSVDFADALITLSQTQSMRHADHIGQEVEP